MAARRVGLIVAASLGALIGVVAMLAGNILLVAIGTALTFSALVGLTVLPPAARPAEEPAAEAPSVTPHETRVIDRPNPATAAAAAGPATVVRNLMHRAAEIAEPVAAHLWLEDGPGGTLRIVSSTGPIAPGREPVEETDAVLGQALEAAAPVLEPLSSISLRSEGSTLWRYALPVLAGEHRGVAAVDMLSAEEPDRGALDALATSMASQFAGALALDIARIETETARTLLEMARDLSAILSVDEVVQACLDKAMRLTDAATGSIMLVDDETGVMRISASRGLPSDIASSATVAAGDGIAGWVLMSGQPVLVEDLPTRPSKRRHGVRSSMSVPLADEHGTVGVLNVGSKAYPSGFTATHMSALETLGRQTAVAVRNARALTSARELYFASLRALALALETKDPYASGSTDRVVAYVSAIAKAMGLADEDEEALHFAALLHDICMDTATDTSSRKQLSTIERGMVTMHPVLAAEILGQAPALRKVVPIVYHHHEWYDGRGYVGGLAGEEIPLGARILAVADAYTAMTSDRAYRRALSREEGVRELQDKAGTQFDPAVVAVFVDLVRTGRERVPETSG